MTEQLTPAEADALFELLEDKVAEFVDNPYTPELAEAIRKVRAVAATHVYEPVKAEQ